MQVQDRTDRLEAKFDALEKQAALEIEQAKHLEEASSPKGTVGFPGIEPAALPMRA